MKTRILLPYARVCWYTHNGARRVDKCFATPEAAQHFIEREKPPHFNLYRIEKINGTWRTDWELEVDPEPEPPQFTKQVAADSDAGRDLIAEAFAIDGRGPPAEKDVYEDQAYEIWSRFEKHVKKQEELDENAPFELRSS